jgi:hypothetical protein
MRYPGRKRGADGKISGRGTGEKNADENDAS